METSPTSPPPSARPGPFTAAPLDSAPVGTTPAPGRTTTTPGRPRPDEARDTTGADVPQSAVPASAGFAPSGSDPGGQVRALVGAGVVPGAHPPYDRVHVRLYYPGAAPDQAALNSGHVRAGTRAPLPLAVIAGGVNCGPEGFSWLAHTLAAAGIAVATYAFPTEVRDGQIGLLPDDGFAGSGRPGRVLSAVVDAVRTLSTQPALGGRIDTTRLAVIGHSAGGRVALTLDPASGPRPSAVVAIGAHVALLGPDSRPVFPTAPNGRPTLLVGGGLDGVIGAAASRNRYGVGPDESWQPVQRTFAEALDGPDDLLAWMPTATHFTFLHPHDPALGRAFLESPDPDAAAHRASAAALIRSFLRRHLLGENTFPQDLELPGIELSGREQH